MYQSAHTIAYLQHGLTLVTLLPALITHHQPVQLAVVAAVEVAVGGWLGLCHALLALMTADTWIIDKVTSD